MDVGNRGAVLKSHGRIAVDDISGLFGASGESSESTFASWLLSKEVLVSIVRNGRMLALATGNRISLVKDSSSKTFSIAGVSKVTCLEWLNFGYEDDSNQHLLLFLAVGTAEGVLLIYSTLGIMLARQMMHNKPLLKLRVQLFEDSARWMNSSQELCAVFVDAIAVIDCMDLQPHLRRRADLSPTDMPTGKVRGSTPWRAEFGVPFRKFQVRKGSGIQNDAALSVSCSASWLLDDRSSVPQYTLASVGKDPAVEFSRIPRYTSPPALSTSRLASSMTKNVAFAATSLYAFGKSSIVAHAPNLSSEFGLPGWTSRAASSIISSTGLDRSVQEDRRAPPKDPLADSPGETAEVTHMWRDALRECTSLVPAGNCQGRGDMMAATDQLGRVLLLDCYTCTVVRLWKGYRDASCAFLLSGEQSLLCLSILAPLKGVLEIWQMRHGGRLASVRCDSHCILLQPSPVLNCVTPSEASHSQHRPTLQAFILQGSDGHLWEVIPPVATLSKPVSMRQARFLPPSSPAELDTFHTLCDFLRRTPKSAKSAREVMQMLKSSPSEEAELDSDLEAISHEEEVLLSLLAHVHSPARQIKALGLMYSCGWAVSPRVHLAALHRVLHNVDTLLAASSSSMSGAPPASVPSRDTIPAPPYVPQVQAGQQGVESTAVQVSISSRSIRKRGSVSKLLSGVQVGPPEEARPAMEGGGPAAPARSATEEEYLQRLWERQRDLSWQQHLVQVYMHLTNPALTLLQNGKGPGSLILKAGQQQRTADWKWDFGRDVRQWWSFPAGLTHSLPAGSAADPTVTSLSFVTAFRYDSSVPPPSGDSSDVPPGTLQLASDSEERFSAGLAPSQQSTAKSPVEALIVSSAVRGSSHMAHIFNLLPLSGHDWQRAFLKWYQEQHFGQLADTVDPHTFCDLIRLSGVQSPLGEGDSGRGAAEAEGGRWPLLLSWCLSSTCSEKVLVLARAVSMAADLELEAMTLDSQAAWSDDSVYDSWWTVDDSLFAWLEAGSQRWHQVCKSAESAFWIERAISCAALLAKSPSPSHSWHGAHSIAELPSFSAAPWIARLELLLTRDPLQIIQLEKSVQATASRSTEVDFGRNESEDDLAQVAPLLGHLLKCFPGSFHPDVLAAHRAMELCRQWAAEARSAGSQVSDSHDCLMAAQGHLALISNVGLKGGLIASMWASLVGPRAASIVSNATKAIASDDAHRHQVSDAMAAKKQLLALLYDCVMLAESGEGRDPSVAHREVMQSDAMCRDAIVDFHMRPPRPERIYAYMVLLRTVGLAVALGAHSLHLYRMFPAHLLASFPALFLDDVSPVDHGGVLNPTPAQMDARLLFLREAMDLQRGPFQGAWQPVLSVPSLAGDMGVEWELVTSRVH